MTDFPFFRWPVLNVITPFHPESNGFGMRLTLNGSASAALGANFVQYWPFYLYEESTAYSISYLVGATQSGNVDVGIYDWGKNRIVNSGSVAQGATNTLQTVDITDTVLVPARYFMAITFSSGTGTCFRSGMTDEQGLAMWPVYSETTGGFGLPSPAAFVLSTAATVSAPAMGVHFNSLV